MKSQKMLKIPPQVWQIRSREKTLFSQDVVKLLHPGFEPYVCAECGKELLLPLRELQKTCLLSEADLKNKKFKGLCPECTRKWLDQEQAAKERGKNISFSVMDDFCIKDM